MANPSATSVMSIVLSIDSYQAEGLITETIVTLPNTEETKPSETEEVIPDPDDDDDDNTGTGSDSGSDDNNDGQKDEKTEETKSSKTTATSAATTATGDNFRPGLWVILVGVACLALAALFLFKKKA